MRGLSCAQPLHTAVTQNCDILGMAPCHPTKHGPPQHRPEHLAHSAPLTEHLLI